MTVRHDLSHASPVPCAEVLAFTVDGEPIPKGRARACVVRGHARVFTPAATRSYEAKIRACCAAAANMARWSWTDADRFAVELVVWRSHELKGGDLDNYVKAIADAANGIAYPDDRRVLRLAASLHVDRANPRVEVRVTRL